MCTTPAVAVLGQPGSRDCGLVQRGQTLQVQWLSSAGTSLSVPYPPDNPAVVPKAAQSPSLQQEPRSPRA